MITQCAQCGGLRADPGEMYGGKPCECLLPPAPGSADSSKHAIISKDGYDVPLIGIPPSAVMDTCDLCGAHIGLSKSVFSGHQILCHRCAADTPPPTCADGQHDYDGALRIGRAHYVCPKCKQDITMMLLLMDEAENPPNEKADRSPAR